MTSWSYASDVPDSSGAGPGEGLLPGARLGAWTVLAQLGEGGMSRVYRVRGPRGEAGALKVLIDPRDPEQRARFLREGQVARALRHEGLVALLDGGEVEGAPFLVFELIEGGATFLQRLSGLGLAKRAELVRDVARAVGAAHAAGVVHRDLKPGNVLIDASGRPRVTDFGLALAEGEARLTRSGAVVGTPLYMAPEQCDPAARQVGPPVDVWALGVMLYQALTGRHPFPAGGWLELRAMIQEGRLVPPREAFPGIPPALERGCLQALAVDPARRFPHAAALAAALDQALAAGVPDGPGSAPPLAAGPAAQPASWLSSPQQLGRKGRFELRGVLGRGGMGVVYLAWDPELNREVALKMVMGARGSIRQERFRREGEITASLTHPGILRVHSLGVLEETPYIVYELITGARTLREVGAGLDRRRQVELVRDTARALGWAHERGVVHRDVKPDNLLIDAEGRVKVADFGLAAVEGQERLTTTGAMVGTPHYMAPELIGGQRDQVGPHTDVWALGVVLYELLCGVLPFQAAQMVELAGRILAATPTPPRELVPDLDPRLEAICARALTPERGRRYRHAGEMADDLDAYLGDRPLSGSTSSWRPGVLQRGRRAAGLALAVLLALLLLVVAWRWPARGPAIEPPAAVASGPAPEVGPDLRWIEAGREAWRRVAREVDRAEELEAIERWLAEYPDHPQAGEARALLAARRFSRPLRVIRGQGSGNARALFLAARRLLIWNREGGFGVWDLDRGGWESWTPLDQQLFVVAQTPFGLVAGGEERLIRLEPSRGPDRAPRFTSSIAVSPDGQLVAVGAKDVRLFDARSGELLTVLVETRQLVEALAFSPDGRLLAASGGPGSQEPGDSLVMAWRVAERELVARSFTPTTGRALAWTPDGRQLWMGTNAGQLLRLDPATLQVELELHTSQKRAGDRGTLLTPTAHLGSMQSVRISPDGRELYSVSKGDEPATNQLKAWDLVEERELRCVTDRPLRLGRMALSPDGELLAVGIDDGRIEVWAAR